MSPSRNCCCLKGAATTDEGAVDASDQLLHSQLLLGDEEEELVSSSSSPSESLSRSSWWKRKLPASETGGLELQEEQGVFSEKKLSSEVFLLGQSVMARTEVTSAWLTKARQSSLRRTYSWN